jgi:hypothetical protein
VRLTSKIHLSSRLQSLAEFEQIIPVYVPAPEMRQYRCWVKYRKTLVWRMNQIRNSIRALLIAQGLTMPARAKAWTLEGRAQLSKHRKPLAECSLNELWRGELDQDLRKGDLNGWGVELLNQLVRQHSLLNLINRSASLISDQFETTPNEQGTSNVIALNPSFATLTRFDTR